MTMLNYDSLISDEKSSVATLMSLGFSEPDVMEALQQSGNNTDSAALWLTQHATPVKSRASATKDLSDGNVSTQDSQLVATEPESDFMITAVEVRKARQQERI